MKIGTRIILSIGERIAIPPIFTLRTGIVARVITIVVIRENTTYLSGLKGNRLKNFIA